MVGKISPNRDEVQRWLVRKTAASPAKHVLTDGFRALVNPALPTWREAIGAGWEATISPLGSSWIAILTAVA